MSFAPTLKGRKDEVYGYVRSDGRLTLASHDSLLQRKAAYRNRNRSLLAEKQRLYRQKEKQMIKHGKIYPLSGKGQSPSHLEPIIDFVTKGIADAKETMTIEPQACDVRGAKRFNGQQCVIAKALQRTLHPQAVSVGRSLAYVVINGLAIRFVLPAASRQLVKEFDQKGRARNVPIELRKVNGSWRLGHPGRGPASHKRKTGSKRERTRKIGVRAIGGGVTA